MLKHAERFNDTKTFCISKDQENVIFHVMTHLKSAVLYKYATQNGAGLYILLRPQRISLVIGKVLNNRLCNCDHLHV